MVCLSSLNRVSSRFFEHPYLLSDLGGSSSFSNTHYFVGNDTKLSIPYCLRGFIRKEGGKEVLSPSLLKKKLIETRKCVM